jgi:DNA-binding transcriptional MerR regulator
MKRPPLDGCLTVSQTARLLGVAPSTLRDWDRSGKLRARRHPVNGYRMYPGEQVERLVRRFERELHGAAR